VLVFCIVPQESEASTGLILAIVLLSVSGISRVKIFTNPPHPFCLGTVGLEEPFPAPLCSKITPVSPLTWPGARQECKAWLLIPFALFNLFISLLGGLGLNYFWSLFLLDLGKTLSRLLFFPSLPVLCISIWSISSVPMLFVFVSIHAGQTPVFNLGLQQTII